MGTNGKSGSRDKIIFLTIIIVCLIIFFTIVSQVIDNGKAKENSKQTNSTETSKQAKDNSKKNNIKKDKENKIIATKSPAVATKNNTTQRQKSHGSDTDPKVIFIKKTKGDNNASNRYHQRKYLDSQKLIWRMCLKEILGLCKDKQNILFPQLGAKGTSIDKIDNENYNIKGYYLYKNKKINFSLIIISFGNTIIHFKEINIKNPD